MIPGDQSGPFPDHPIIIFFCWNAVNNLLETYLSSGAPVYAPAPLAQRLDLIHGHRQLLIFI